MKKIFSDKSFWLILIVSVISLIVLTIGVVFLTRKNTKEFYSAGYIISSTASRSDKYYFDDNTVYKENVFNEYVFEDVDNNEVSTSKNNFIHYLDNSLSFMKNGVILDLDNFNQNIVPYYNITDKSIIKYSNGGYYIETADKTLIFSNFLGRISDNKYIVVGKDISVKLAGNTDMVKGNYFEILFVENGIVKIENQEVSFQTISDGTIIYVGNDIKINLGDKIVSYGDEEKLSLSEMTIDGNENIDIKPDDGIIKEENNKPDSSEKDPSGTGNNIGTETGTDSDEDGSDNSGETNTVLRKEVSVNLLEASSDVNSISARFQIIDTAEAINGDLILTLVNTTSPEEPENRILTNVFEEQSVYFNKLVSNTNYVMTITDESGIQYFQKSFTTKSLDLKLKRLMATENSLTYLLEFGPNSDIVSAEVSIFDSKDGEKIDSQVVERESGTNNSKVIFDTGLTHNHLYDVVVDNVCIDNIEYGKYYSSKTSDWTLKNRPELGDDLSVKANNDTKNFTLSLGSYVDDDHAIVSYTYQIFKAEDITEDNINIAPSVYSFTRYVTDDEDRKNLFGDEILKLDEAKNLYGNQDYRFRIVAKYYDNYRYNEIRTDYSSYFQIIGKPTIRFEPTIIESDRIAGTIFIEDTDCTIPFKGRECRDAVNNFSIRYEDEDGETSGKIEEEDLIVDADNQTISFDLGGNGILKEDTEYTFRLFGDMFINEEVDVQEDVWIGDSFDVTTAKISELEMKWNDNSYSFENPISVDVEMSESNKGDSSIDNLASITFNLYAGKVPENSIERARPIGSFTVTENIKDIFYEKKHTINSNMFEFIDKETSEILKIEDLNVLSDLSDGSLSDWYTIEATDAQDEYGKPFRINGGVHYYKTPAILILENEVIVPNINLFEITNDISLEYGIEHDSSLESGTVRGYAVTVGLDELLVNKIENAYNDVNKPITKINFYVRDINGELRGNESLDFTGNGEYTTVFVLGNGTDYTIDDADLRRGNTYTFSYDISIDDDNDPETSELLFPTVKPSDEGIPEKQEPTFKMYVDNSDESSITYKYQVIDHDSALYMEDGKYYLYYTVSGSDEKYKAEIVNDGNSNVFTLSNLSNSSIYNISYNRALIKDNGSYEKNIGSYFFDGHYDSNDYNIGYRLEYGNSDNRLKVIIDDNELLNRVSNYLLTLNAEGKVYRKVISNLDTCGENKCIIVDYNEILDLKGKDITVTLEAFYDTGYVGFGQDSLLGSYFKDLDLVDEANASKVGFVYQTTGELEKGKYFTISNTGFSGLSDYPRGILGFELVTQDSMESIWKLNSWNLVSEKEKKFVNFGDIKYSNSAYVSAKNSIMNYFENDANANLLYAYTVNPKVLDKITIQTDDNYFKFTSITPKVSAEVSPLINGAIMNIDYKVQEDTLKSDFVATDGKYKFYIDLYQKKICTESDGEECTEELISVGKTIETDYENLSRVEFEGLKPDTEYYFRISADMNKNGENVKTFLFESGRDGYVWYLSKFNTLNAKQVFKNVTYDYDSTINKNVTPYIYNNRVLTINTYLHTNVNFNLKYQLFDAQGTLEYEYTAILNEEDSISNPLIYTQDVTGDDFVFGPGYHNLVITAVTTDLGSELELYNEKLVYKDIEGWNFHELREPTFNLKLTPSTTEHKITAEITVTDEDKVIKDGSYEVKIQYEGGINACPGNEANCNAKVDIKNGTCSFANGSCKVKAQTGDSQTIEITFNNLKAETPYWISYSADIYRNNYGLSDESKNSEVSNGKLQYTIGSLNFSLGSVSPVVASDKSIEITFAGAANLNKSLKGIEYNVINSDDQNNTSVIGYGKLGTTDTTTGTLKFGVDDEYFYPTLTIPITGKIGKINYLYIVYYYDDDGNDDTPPVMMDFGPRVTGSYCADTACNIPIQTK